MYLSDLKSNLLAIGYSDTQIEKILSDSVVNKNTTLEACSGINNGEPVFVQAYSEWSNKKDEDMNIDQHPDQVQIKNYISTSDIKSPIFSNPNYTVDAYIDPTGAIGYWWDAKSIEDDLTVNNLVSDYFSPTISDQYGDSIKNSAEMLQIIKRIVDRQFKFEK